MDYVNKLHQSNPDKSIAHSTEDDTISSLDVGLIKTCTVLVKITYNGSATKGGQVNVYPIWSDGTNTLTCTEPLVELSVPLDTSNAVVWASVPINVEDCTDIAVRVENLDGSYAMVLNSIAVYGVR
ncbi:MAG: hypothetical protein ACXQS4_01645 [Methermicoccaceae archaeon]